MDGSNNNGISYYIGQYCSPIDQQSIHLGVFTDPYCNIAADVAIFPTIYGFELPYASTSLVNSECISCLQASESNSGAATESCYDLYNNAVRCEANMDIATKDESGCFFINNELGPIPTVTNSTLQNIINRLRTMFTNFISNYIL